MAASNPTSISHRLPRASTTRSSRIDERLRTPCALSRAAKLAHQGLPVNGENTPGEYAGYWCLSSVISTGLSCRACWSRFNFRQIERLIVHAFHGIGMDEPFRPHQRPDLSRVVTMPRRANRATQAYQNSGPYLPAPTLFRSLATATRPCWLANVREAPRDCCCEKPLIW